MELQFKMFQLTQAGGSTSALSHAYKKKIIIIIGVDYYFQIGPFKKQIDRTQGSRNYEVAFT